MDSNRTDYTPDKVIQLFIFEHNESETENWADQVTGRGIVFFSLI